MSRLQPVARSAFTLFLLTLLPACSVVQQVQERIRPSAQVFEPEPIPPPMEVEPEDPRVEVLWDTYGVPHIFAEDAGALFYAFGWAQMRSHADLLLRLYGQARGRAAEYWGEQFVDSDTWVLTHGIPGRAERWLGAQSPHMMAYLEAFVAGINAYAERNPGGVGEEWKAVLPVVPADVLAHQQRILQFTFMASPRMVTAVARQWQAGGSVGAGGGLGGLPAYGSNAWAVAPARTARGSTLLLINPHLPWGDLFTWYEAHLVGPGISAYGATLVGFPTLAMGFNDDLGWAHTVNTIDSADLYELTLDGDGYVLDGIVRAFETERRTLHVRQPDGGTSERTINIQRSIHGPIVARREGRALALRVAGLDAANLADQYWDMIRSANLAQFEAALSRLQLPTFTVIYADRAGNILHVFNGAVPVRSRGDWAWWQGVVPGDSSATLWTQMHPYHALPRVLNPETGWLQNANDPPWSTTVPFPLDPFYFPPYMAPQRPMAFRPQQSARMLAEAPRMTLEQMVQLKHSTYVGAADHLVHDVAIAARASGNAEAVTAAEVLERWDRRTDAGSRGALLFQEFYRAVQRHRWPDGSPWEIRWTARAPLSTPDGLSDPRAAVELLVGAARRVQAARGALDSPWGDVHRLRTDGVDLPANGGSGDIGVFRVVDFEPVPGDTARLVATGGDSFVAAVEFSRPVRAHTLIGYGNASQPGSPHRTDQIELFARKQLRPAWLTRDDVLENLALREVF
ncbi:MAG TPA: acylase [Longimicrobiales bacterium]|nr:acylase [Longimicrobiales bacterium]